MHRTKSNKRNSNKLHNNKQNTNKRKNKYSKKTRKNCETDEYFRLKKLLIQLKKKNNKTN
jgi:hypothetical protein